MSAPLRPAYPTLLALEVPLPLGLAGTLLVVWPGWECGLLACGCRVLDQDLREHWRGVTAPTPWDAEGRP